MIKELIEQTFTLAAHANLSVLSSCVATHTVFYSHCVGFSGLYSFLAYLADVTQIQQLVKAGENVNVILSPDGNLNPIRFTVRDAICYSSTDPQL